MLELDDGYFAADLRDTGECVVHNPWLHVFDVPADDVPARHAIAGEPVAWWPVDYVYRPADQPMLAITDTGSLAGAEKVLGRTLGASSFSNEQERAVPRDDHVVQVVAVISTCAPLGPPSLLLDGVRLSATFEDIDEDTSCDSLEQYAAVWALPTARGPFQT